MPRVIRFDVWPSWRETKVMLAAPAIRRLAKVPPPRRASLFSRLSFSFR
jgi:hypothetical protein